MVRPTTPKRADIDPRGRGAASVRLLRGHVRVFGIALAGGLWCLSVGSTVTSCVDQPLVALSHNSKGGGNTAGGTQGSASGGSSSSFGSGGAATPTFGGSDATGECLLKGDSCSPGGAECCLGLDCVDGHCEGCAQTGDSCEKASNCCSYTCSFLKCVQAFACSKALSPCWASTASDCCSGRCVVTNSATGQGTCAKLGGCQPIGESCGADLDCCSANCNKGICGDSNICLGSGETRCSQFGGAASGYCCPDTVCAPDEQQVPRCKPNLCVDQGMECSHDDACCQGSGPGKAAQCVYAGGSRKRMCVSCSPLGEACGNGTNCCGDRVCSNGTCVAPSTGAGGTGNVGTQTAPNCAAEGESCGILNCCSPLNCDSLSTKCVLKP